MARPRKQGLEYFPMDINMFDDPKILFVEDRFGSDGEIVVIKLLCWIYRNGYCCEWSDEHALLFAKKQFSGIKFSTCKGVVDELLKRGFFDLKTYQNFGVLTSRGIQKRWRIVMEKMKRKAEIDPDIDLLKKEETPALSEETPTKTEETKNCNSEDVSERPPLANKVTEETAAKREETHIKKEETAEMGLKREETPAKRLESATKERKGKERKRKEKKGKGEGIASRDGKEPPPVEAGKPPPPPSKNFPQKKPHDAQKPTNPLPEISGGGAAGGHLAAMVGDAAWHGELAAVFRIPEADIRDLVAAFAQQKAGRRHESRDDARSHFARWLRQLPEADRRRHIGSVRAKPKSAPHRRQAADPAAEEARDLLNQIALIIKQVEGGEYTAAQIPKLAEAVSAKVRRLRESDAAGSVENTLELPEKWVSWVVEPEQIKRFAKPERDPGAAPARPKGTGTRYREVFDRMERNAAETREKSGDDRA